MPITSFTVLPLPNRRVFTGSSPSQWEENDRVVQFLRARSFADELEIGNNLSDGHPKLMGINDAGEMAAGLLPAVGHLQEVVVLGKDNAAQFSRPLQQLLVWHRRSPVFTGGQNVDSPPSQPLGDTTVDMMVHE